MSAALLPVIEDCSDEFWIKSHHQSSSTRNTWVIVPFFLTQQHTRTVLTFTVYGERPEHIGVQNLFWNIVD